MEYNCVCGVETIGSISNEYKYYVVAADALPKAMLKVAEAKRILKSGLAGNTSEAVKMVGISRSVFYKYKDSIRPFYDKEKDRIVTFSAMLNDYPGVLSSFLSVLANAGANILTINQNIPVNGIAPITVSAQTDGIRIELDKLMDNLRSTKGIINVDIIAGE